MIARASILGVVTAAAWWFWLQHLAPARTYLPDGRLGKIWVTPGQVIGVVVTLAVIAVAAGLFLRAKDVMIVESGTFLLAYAIRIQLSANTSQEGVALVAIAAVLIPSTYYLGKAGQAIARKAYKPIQS